ncbi:MAG: alpha/beta fold hydrolase [Synechococcales bacterium]|nr:alpha/beta fold hydrolase [Synechococcales bacterium]
MTLLYRYLRPSLGVVAIGAIAYACICLALWRWQTRFIFFPPAVLKATPADVQLAYEDVWLAIDGDTLHGWWIPAPVPEAPVILYFHGNASNLGDLVNQAARYHQWGYGAFLIDYRGYGKSSGAFPHEQQVYEDAAAAWAYLTQERGIPAHRIVIHGQSLGGAIALELATRQPSAAGVIVESSFTSIRRMVDHQTLYNLVPIDWLLTQRFDSLAKVPTLEVPLLLLHGTADETVPPDMSQALYDAAPEPKSLVWFAGATHDNLPSTGGEKYAEAIRSFVDSLR